MSNKFTGITSAGSAIPVYDKDAHSALEQKLDTSAFSSVSGEFATVDDVVAAVSSKADVSAIPSLDGYATQEWVGEQGYLTEVPEGYATTEDVISATSGLQPSGDYLSASESANFYPMTGNPSGFLTEHQSLDGYLQNTDLTIVDNKITEISGIPLSAGDELPSGVMNTSALGYNAVNEISGYNGSAIAQYGAEKQWLVHDDTLVHAANSAQYALGVNLSAVAQLLGVDETVLFTTSTTAATTADVSLSESRQNFERLQIFAKDDNGNMFTFDMFSDVSAVRGMGSYNVGAQWFGMRAEEIVATNDTTLSISDVPQMSWTSAGAFRNFGHGKFLKINKVIGIGRISSSDE